MSETVSLSQLIVRLSEETGADSNTSRIFVRELFAAVAEAMAEGETVELPGIGTFKRSTEPSADSQPRVLYRPDSALATAVNAPFSMFEPHEVPDDFNPTDTDTATASTVASESVENAESLEATTAEQHNIVAEETQESAAHAQFNTEQQNASLSQTEATVSASTITPTPEIPTEDSANNTDEADSLAAGGVVATSEAHTEPDAEATSNAEGAGDVTSIHEVDDADGTITPSFPEGGDEDVSLPEPEQSHGYRWLWIILAALVVGVAVGIYAGLTVDVSVDDGETQEPTNALEPDSALVVNTVGDSTQAVSLPTVATGVTSAAKSTAIIGETATADANVSTGVGNSENSSSVASASEPEPVYETVSSTNYLSTMARRHYGKSVYWVYIYEANAEKLGHPDRIAPGTRLLIPPKSSFPTTASEAEAVEMAQRKAAEIQERFR